MADRTAIEQVLINLIVNSCEALDGLMNDIERKPKIMVTLTSSDSHAIIRVQDNGRGIDEDVKDEIFNSFVTTKIDGVGLGLNLSMGPSRSIGAGSVSPRPVCREPPLSYTC